MIAAGEYNELVLKSGDESKKEEAVDSTGSDVKNISC
jgi:hypothetical protein